MNLENLNEIDLLADVEVLNPAAAYEAEQAQQLEQLTVEEYEKLYDKEEIAAAFKRMKAKVNKESVTVKTEEEREYVAKQHEYWDRIQQATPKKEITIDDIVGKELTLDKAAVNARRQRRKQLDFQDGRKLFWSILQKMVEKENAKKQPSKRIAYDCSDNVKMRYLSEIVKWCCNDDSSKLDLSKGIYLFSEQTGSGKSMVAEAISHFFERMSKVDKTFSPFEFQNCRLLSQQIKDKEVKVSRFFRPCNLNLDDLGFDAKYNDYGSMADPMIDIVNAQYLNIVNGHDVRILATSNLDPNELELRYGDRVQGRLAQIFNFVYWDGRNYRIEPNIVGR